MIGLLELAAGLGVEHAMASSPGLNSARREGFDLIAPLGGGGEAEVWLAHAPHTGHRVAVKALRKKDDGVDIGLLQHEAAILSSVKHRGVVAPQKLGGSADAAYLVLDFVDGIDLKTYIEDGTPGDRTLRGLLMALVEAVAVLHRNGVVHGDLKPANVLVDQDGQPVIIDFGLARWVATARNEVRAMPIVSSYRRGGTPGYRAPELCRSDGAAPTTESDVYSLASTLIEVVQPRRAFAGWVAPLRRSLAADPGQRYADADALRVALRRVENRRRARHWKIAAALALSSLLTAAFAGHRLTPRPPTTTAASVPLPQLFEEAAAAWRFGQTDELIAKLQEVPERSRGWTWSFMNRVANDEGVDTLWRPPASLPVGVSLLLSATPSADTVCWYESQNGRHVVSVQPLGAEAPSSFPLPSRPRSLSISPDGQYVGAVLADRSLWFADTRPAGKEATWAFSDVRARGYGFGGDGVYRWIDLEDRRLREAGPHQRRPLEGFGEDTAYLRSVSVSGRTPLHLVISDAGVGVQRVQLIDRQARLQQVTDRPPTPVISCAAASADGSRLFFATADGTIWRHRFDVPGDSPEVVWQDPQGMHVLALAYSEENDLLFAGSHLVRVIDVRGGKLLVDLPFGESQEAIRALHWNADSQSLVIHATHSLRRWSAAP